MASALKEQTMSNPQISFTVENNLEKLIEDLKNLNKPIFEDELSLSNAI